MAEVIEQRLKPTIIRRRAKQEEAPAPSEPSEPQEEAQAVPQAAAPQTVASTVASTLPRPEIKSGLISPPPAKTGVPSRVVIPSKGPVQALGAPRTAGQTTVQPKFPLKPASALSTKELEDKFKKSPKKKLSRAEMDLEDIKRAGGLMHFVRTEVGEEVVAPVVKERERVFEPGPRRKRTIKRDFHKTKITQPKASKKVIKIAETITVSELSQNLSVKAGELIKKLMDLGLMVTANQSIDLDTAILLAKEYDHEIEQVAFKEEDVFKESTKKRPEQVAARPPVVTVMGHVDHGKTSVLDFIRKTKVASGEAGGITQHIGAYDVVTPKGRITFIDTPGHAAFTAMRARGAKVTDIVILVVAADDGVMPQTKEAIDHARSAGVPIIVAINKIDKPEANIERVKRSLSEYGILPEDWGGDSICVSTSAKTGQGIDQLLDMVLLQSEVMELAADAAAATKGTIIEARLDRGLGPVATVLVQEGTLKTGMAVLCGLHWGKVRTLINSLGQQVASAGPSDAVSIIGLSGVPLAGDELMEVASDKDAREVSEMRQKKQRTETLAKATRVTLEDLHKHVEDGSIKELGVVLKADVHGSVEAIKESLVRLSTEKVNVKVLHAGVGAITESDVMLATAGTGIIIGFNVVPESGVAQIAEREGIEIRRYSIIYELMDEVRKSMEGLLTPLSVEKIIGHAEVRQVFTVSKAGVIAGSFVKDGKVLRNAGVRLLRDNKVVYTGKMDSLKRFKDDAKEVIEGNECGISMGYNDIKEGDVIEAFIIEQIAQKL